ncbi:MAG: type II toxin-antitoxin system RelE/ParE family toxin [Terriglobia bacterium]
MKAKLCWAEEAAADLENIANYLFQNAPERAAELVRGIYNAPAGLLMFPQRGRGGRKEGTRELVLSPLPWTVVYRITGECVYVVRILHGAQKWP